MGYTNKTSHYDLPQWIAGDKPSWLGDVNTAMLNIDTAIAGADASATAAESSAAAANAQVQAQEAKITKNTTDIQALTENLADTQGEVNNIKTIAEGALPKSGGTMTGNLILNAAPTSDLQAATKKYVDDNSGKGALMLSGGTMTGPLTLSGAPTADLQAATKKYVDDNKTAVIPLKSSLQYGGGGGAYMQGGIIGNALSIGFMYSVAAADISKVDPTFVVDGNPLGLPLNSQKRSDNSVFTIRNGSVEGFGYITAIYNGTKTTIVANVVSEQANDIVLCMFTGVLE